MINNLMYIELKTGLKYREGGRNSRIRKSCYNHRVILTSTIEFRIIFMRLRKFRLSGSFLDKCIYF